jgi:hypothetical protein
MEWHSHPNSSSGAYIWSKEVATQSKLHVQGFKQKH